VEKPSYFVYQKTVRTRFFDRAQALEFYANVAARKVTVDYGYGEVAIR
jgi:hypothetical protein